MSDFSHRSLFFFVYYHDITDFISLKSEGYIGPAKWLSDRNRR